RVEGMRLPIAADDHHVWLFLPPGQRPLCSVDFNEQIVLAPVRDLTGRDRAQGAVLESNDGRAVVVELPALLENLQAARHFGGNQPGHVTSQIVSVRADVAKAAGG